MSGSPQETTGIARFYRLLRLDPKTGAIDVMQRDLARGFTTANRIIAATGVLTTIATVNASAQGICYGLVLSQVSGGTGGSVTLWEGTASTRKFQVFMIPQDTMEFSRDETNPLFKWQGVKVLRGRAGGSGQRIAVNMAYWAEPQ